MPPTCALLGMAKAPPSGNQLSHLLDLPIEIRYMIYERLRDRTVPVAINDLEVPDCISVCATLVLNCFYPVMLRINAQIADEYTFIVMIEFLQKLVDAGSIWTGKMMVYITCSLYLLDEESLYGIPVDFLEYRYSPNVVFAICSGPDEDTFQLDGLHLKFVGMEKIQIERRVAEDGNIVVTITAHEDG